MFELVISGGDSFTFGAELSDDLGYHPNHNSWANLLALRIGKHHINTARSGRGNSYIVRHVLHTVISALNKGINPADIFVQVMWSFVNRHEFALASQHSEYDSPWYGISPMAAIDETESDWFKQIDKNSQNYYSTYKDLKNRYKKNLNLGMVTFTKHFVASIQSNALHDSYTSASLVLQLQDFLKLRNINYCFSYVNYHVMNGLFEDCQNNPGTKYLGSIRTQIDPANWYAFPGNHQKYIGFDDWAKYNAYSYATSHPLEKAHSDAANLMYDFIQQKGYLDGNSSR